MDACGVDGNHGAHLSMGCAWQNFGPHGLSPLVLLLW